MPFPNNGSFSDPFARNTPGAQRPAPRPEGGPQSWAGYGIGPERTQGCPPHPVDALSECIRAMAQILENSLQVTDLAPWIHAPYRGVHVARHTRTVLSVTAAVNPAAQAAGAAIQAANQTVANWVVPLLEMNAAGDWQTIFTYDVPISHDLRVQSWGITVGNGLPESVIVRVVSPSATGGTPDPPNAFLGGHQAEEQTPVWLLAQGGQTVQIQVGLRDFANPNPVLIDFGLIGWVFPVSKRVDSREDNQLRSGYGVDCK